MSRIDSLNSVGLCLSVLLSIWGTTLSSGRGSPEIQRGPELTVSIAPERLADGSLVLRDAGGARVPLVRYSRIASATMIADQVLSEICEPDRILAFSDYGARSSRIAYRLSGKPTLAARANVEEVLALAPDLLLVNNLVDPGYVARLREHGVQVFDLGHMRGLPTLEANISALGLLIGEPTRAEHFKATFRERLERVAPAVPEAKRPRALYLAIYADKLYGGAARTSYHEVLVHAAMRDAAAEAGLDGWPELSSERVLGLNPDVLVTKIGMGAVLCRHVGLSALPACRGQGRLVEVDGVLLDDPGPTILEASEALVRAYWGKHPGRNGLSPDGRPVQD